MEQTTTTSTTTTDRPASMEAALASVEAPSASTPEPTTTDPSTPAAAIAQPGADDAPTQDLASAEPQKGEPPKWRWQDILANARETAAKEAEARARQELEQQYSGLKDFAQIDANERAGLLVWRAALNGHPQALAHIQSNPHAMQMLQRLVAAGQPAKDEPMPEADLQSADGTLVYSATQMQKLREWDQRRLTQQLMGQVHQQLQPLQTVAQTMQTRERMAAFHQTTASAVDRMKASDPDFETHKAKVGELIQQDQRLLKMAIEDGDPETAMEIAWSRVYRRDVLPAKAQKSEAEHLAKLQRDAVAGTVNPAAATNATPKRPTSMAEALKLHGVA